MNRQNLTGFPRVPEFPAQGIQQGKYSRKKTSCYETRMNTGDSQSTWEFTGK
jgi:hypothetical protein